MMSKAEISRANTWIY